MSAYQFVNPAPLFFNIPGTEILDAGTLHFYIEDTTTPKNTWSDPALTILNSNPVDLDASGRANVGIWLDGNYSVVLKDSLGATVWTRVVRSDVIAGLSIPALVADYILSNDGSNLIWVNPLGALFPDPTGSAGYVLGTDGTSIFWTPQPTIPEPEQPEIVLTANSLRAGTSADETKALIQAGTDTAPNSGTYNTSKAVTYPIAFSSTPYPVVTPVGGPFTSGNGAGGYYADFSITAQSNTGFTVTFNGNHGEENDDGKFNTTVAFNWIAFGNVEVPA